MKQTSRGSHSTAESRASAVEPSLEECFSWRDDEIGVEFPHSLAGNVMLLRQTYGDDGLGYSLRYGACGVGDGVPHFDLYVYGHGEAEIPDGLSPELVAQMAFTVTSVSDPNNPLTADGRFPDGLSIGSLEKTGIPVIACFGSYRNVELDVPFETAAILFAYRGRFIKIRYSEPLTEKTPDSLQETFNRFEESLLHERTTMQDRVSYFLQSLDGLLFASLPQERKELLQASTLLEIPMDSDGYAAELAGEMKQQRAEASGICTDQLRRKIARAVAVFKKHRGK